MAARLFAEQMQNQSVNQNRTNSIIPERCKWVIIKNRNYEKLRQMEGYGSFADIPHVDTDATNVKKGVLGLGARRSDIIELENASFDEIK